MLSSLNSTTNSKRSCMSTEWKWEGGAHFTVQPTSLKNLELNLRSLLISHFYPSSFDEELTGLYHPPGALHSDDAGLSVTRKVPKSTTGGRSLRYLAPLLWNHLPASVWGGSYSSALED